MVDVESMSDEELRSKLLEFGYPVMPITGTTRKTMVKKLKMLMENKNKVGKDTRRSLGRYSSEEESDSDSKAKKNRRATMAAPTMPPRKRASKVDEPPVKKEVRTSTTTTRSMKIVKKATDEFDTGSESDEVAEKYNSASSYTPKKRTPSPPPRLPSTYLSTSSASDPDKGSQIRPRLSQSYTYNRSSYLATSSPTDLLEDKETPYLSDFTRTLKRVTETPPPINSYGFKSDIIKENDINGGTSSTRYLGSYRAGRGRPSTYEYRRSRWNVLKEYFFSHIVIILTVGFFIVIGVAYITMRSDTAVEVTATIPICVKSDPKLRRYVNCVMENEVKPAIRLTQVLKPELNAVAVRHKCENHLKPYMTEQDVIAFITSNFVSKNVSKIQADLNNVEVLSFVNPPWGIAVLQLDKDGAEFTPDAIATDMDQVNEGKRTKVTALLSRNPSVPWKCYFYNTFWTFFSILTSIIGGAAILYVINATYRYYKQRRMKEHEEEVAMVEQIIDILQTNASESDDNYMVINHVRDMILPVSDRKGKQKRWNNAVKYIDENESRIRTEVQVVRGEPAEVWRWLGGASLSTSKNKSWQGQAFETQVGSVNSLPCSPTPCLKIRGMVEEGERNTLAIKKAVLNKCAQQCRILHCAVDTNSNCVYLKCADPSDAAVAYRNLHGWWYAGNLVTVKYLRLERYMQRFPDSPVSGPPFLQ